MRCTDPELLIGAWEAPPAWVPEFYDESNTWDVPTYTVCLEPWTALIYEFYNSDEAQAEQLTWLSFDEETN